MAVSFSWTLDFTTDTTATTSTSTPGAVAGAEMPRDIAIDPSTGDLMVSNGDLVYNSGLEGVASDLISRLKTFGPGTMPDGTKVEGEHFLDTSIGVDYWGKVFVKGANLPEIEQMFRQVALDTPGIVEVPTCQLTLVDRIAKLNLKAKADTGELVSVTLKAINGEE
jgi:hypothetical protein